ncbi:sphingomyelin phosphodiesterase [Leptospira alstonii serovar Pingchang str. 80-412]|uniref:Sphingomyelin phosphodiesterase n=3 Tax=Leptospira alstonii TaxID=28452 RepID=M6CVE8_9LEPT|nr:sphingomyelin phosphodiesterase [Leptospira alstonii serovar Sichuan str. 79601]EQA80595.1 sphingomyelin phosphodiesterase [Leptospira alstonii serovar Pingchang str. 80-412]
MKTMLNVFRKEKEKRSNENKNFKFFVGCWLSLFFLNCLPDKQTSYNDLLMSLLLTPKNQNIESPSAGSMRMGTERSGSMNEGIKVLSYSLFMLQTGSQKGLVDTGKWGQEKRAKLLAGSEYVKNQDVIVFEGLLYTKAKNNLLNGLRSQYPNQTDVIGRVKYGWDNTLGDLRPFPPENDYNGGVVVLSKWPIEEKTQYIFSNHGCGNDYYYDKGFAYVRINKHGQKIHIIGTDVQSKNSSCSDSGRSVRKHQFYEIKKFIDSKQIPNTETVLIVGSLNVEKGSEEYHNMLTILGLNEPNYAGIPFTWDPKKNAIAAYDGRDKTPEYSEYILVSKGHSQPPVWQNLAYDPISPTTWQEFGYTSYEFSDHYPVYGFFYADASTPTKSAHRRKYDQVSFMSVETGKKIQADPKRADGWLQVDAPNETDFTKFNLFQEYNPDSNSNCIVSGSIRIEPSQYLNFYWTWWLGGGGGNYAYYPKFNDGSNRLEIKIIGKEKCLESGSAIAFKDYDTLSAGYYYLTNWDRGSWKEYVYLWKTYTGSRELFYAQLNTTPEKDWSKDLIYR